MHFSTTSLWEHYINLNSGQRNADLQTLLLWTLLFIRLNPLRFQMAGLLSSTMYFSFWMDKSLWAHLGLPGCPQCYLYQWSPVFSQGLWDKHPLGPCTWTTDTWHWCMEESSSFNSTGCMASIQSCLRFRSTQKMQKTDTHLVQTLNFFALHPKPIDVFILNRHSMNMAGEGNKVFALWYSIVWYSNDVVSL